MQHRTQPKADPKRDDFLSYRAVRDKRDRYLERRYSNKPAETFLIRSDHFLRLFNEDFKLKGRKALSRRTLQFYSSPQAKLLPLPVYKQRHTAHYVFPDHYERLAVIWTLRARFFFPIELIRDQLGKISPEHYPLILDWDQDPGTLLDTVMMLGRGFEYDDMAHYIATKDLFSANAKALLTPNVDAEKATAALLEDFEKKYADLKKWLASGQAVDFYRKLAQARREQPELEKSPPREPR